MARNLLQIHCEGNQIQLSWKRDKSPVRMAPPNIFQHPFSAEMLAELRWYLESYLPFPYGIQIDRANEIEGKLKLWGYQLFQLVFHSSEQAHSLFQQAVGSALDQCEISIVSKAPEILNLPWELLYSPHYEFLAFQLGGIYRSIPDLKIPKRRDKAQDKLNILLVIARPYGQNDISFRSIARPVLDALKSIRHLVNIKVLRPPSFEQLERELNNHKGYYHIVHFDGHGSFDNEGVIIFEKTNGSAQAVTATQLVQNFANCQIPLFVLNSCNSAEECSDEFSSIAARLIMLGVKGVLAMSYSVYAVAAKHFMVRFYESLARGDSLAEAVTAGRRTLLNTPYRPTPRGDMPLQDWMVPILYQQKSFTPFTPISTGLSFEELITQINDSPVDEFDLELARLSSHNLIGRDYDILNLEKAFRQNHVALLQGISGLGKTELACGFAKWLHDTQGCIGGIFFASFQQKIEFRDVVKQIGEQLGGNRFLQLPEKSQFSVVLKHLQTNPCLLIWDNFEAIEDSLNRKEPLLSEIEQQRIKQFLRALRGGQSWVLIISQKIEPWLNCGYTLLELDGLNKPDTVELANRILQSAGIDLAQLPPEYLELLRLLGGHPLSMNVVLPHLKTKDATQLIESIKSIIITFRMTERDSGQISTLFDCLKVNFSIIKYLKETLEENNNESKVSLLENDLDKHSVFNQTMNQESNIDDVQNEILNLKVFLCHANEDKAKVEELYNWLKKLGIQPWLDKIDLIPGQRWKPAIRRAIKSANIFLACISNRSLTKRGTVHSEIKQALEVYREFPEGSIYFIPAFLEEIIPENNERLPEEVQDVHWVKLYEKDGFEKLIQAFSEAKKQEE